MEIKELVKTLRDMLPPKVDYADLVCAEGGHHGHTYVWEDPEPYFIEQAANTLEKLFEENKQFHNDLIMQTALAQNGQSAIETNKQLRQQLIVLKAERDAAIEDLQRALWDDEICPYCKHNHHCEDIHCDEYIEGRGMTDENGKYFDWKWSCMDFNWGTCAKLENTPCHGCNLINNFEWRGVIRE